MGGKIIALLLAAALIAGCGGSNPGDSKSKGDDPAGAKSATTSEADKAPAEGEPSDEPKPVVLTAEERQKLGITTAPAQAITFNDSSTAFGVVLSHESIAQAVADLETAAGAAHLSQVALTRAQKLAAGPGALGVDTLETLQKQNSADQTALVLARRKITAVVGVRFPWQGAEGDRNVLDALASGEAKLVRATFPSGVFAGAAPKTLRLVSLEPGAETFAGAAVDPGSKSATRAGTVAGADSTPGSAPATRAGDAALGITSLTASPVWDAPQDTNLPGRSFFALIRKANIAEGARFQVLPGAPANGVPGVLVPATAVVITGGQYWCYLEKKAGTFARVPIVIDKPLGAGYFVSDGVGLANGDQVVTSAAGLLLAREMNAASGPED
jgi:hypothetical protein